MNPTFYSNNNTIIAVSGGESSGGMNTLAYTIVNNDEPNVSFTRASSQSMNAPSTTYNIQTNGGFTAVFRIRFTDIPTSYERVFQFSETGSNTNGIIFLRGGGTDLQLSVLDAVSNSYNCNGGTIVQNRWTNVVARYTLSTNTTEIIQDGVSVGTTSVPILANRTLAYNVLAADVIATTTSNLDIVGFMFYDRNLSTAEINTCNQILAGSLPPGDAPSGAKYSLIARSLGLADGANVSSWGGFSQATTANQPVFWRRFNNWVGLGNSIFSSYSHDIAYARNRWVAVGVGTNTLAYSNDGMTWTGLGSGIFSSSGLGIASSTTRWVAGGSGTAHSLAYSADGISWTGLGKTIFEICYQTAWNPNLSRWVAVGHNNPVNQTTSIAYSSDGSAWTIASSPFTGTLNSVAYCVATAILSGGGTLWVAGGQINSANNSLAYSTDGITWTPVTNSLNIFSTYCYGVAWNGLLWVAVGSGTSHCIATSTDGINWTGRGKPGGLTIGRRVRWTGTYWLVAGEPATNGNGLAISYDGTNWTGITRQGVFTTRGMSVGSNFPIL